MNTIELNGEVFDLVPRKTIIEEQQQTFTTPHDVNSEYKEELRPEDYPVAIDPEEKVNHPQHYNKGNIEVIEIMEQIARDYEPDVAVNISNVIKYIARANHKDNLVEDLNKAKWYLNRAVELVSEDETTV